MPHEHATDHAAQVSDCTRRAFLQRTTLAAGAAAAATALRPSAQAIAAASAANGALAVGVIGCGGRGNAHIEVLEHLQKEDKSVRIAAVCDVYRPRLKKAERRTDAKGYMDHRELLAQADVDLVSIATPDHHHAPQAIDAVKAGKHCYCEKPVTHWRQFEITKQLAEAVKASGKAFQLGTQGMSDSAWHQMKALVKQGRIGQPIHAECGFFRVGDWGERGMTIDDPNAVPGPDLDWEAFLGDAPKRDFDVSRFFRWRMYEDYAGGPVTDLFPHTLTPVIDILGAGFPSAVVATGGMFRYTEREVPDTFNMLMDYPEKLTIALLGTQGNDYQTTEHRGSGQRIPVIRGWEGTLTVKADEILFVPAAETKHKEERWAIEHGENMLHHYRNLLAAAREGHQNTWSPADLALHTQTALIMGMLAFREGRTIRFDPEKAALV